MKIPNPIALARSELGRRIKNGLREVVRGWKRRAEK